MNDKRKVNCSNFELVLIQACLSNEILDNRLYVKQYSNVESNALNVS